MKTFGEATVHAQKLLTYLKLLPSGTVKMKRQSGQIPPFRERRFQRHAGGRSSSGGKKLLRVGSCGFAITSGAGIIRNGRCDQDVWSSPSFE
jgi:hypothetical protein